MASTSICMSSHSAQGLCASNGLSHLKTVAHDVAGPQGVSFDGAIIAKDDDSNVSVLWFIKGHGKIELYAAEPIHHAAAQNVVATYLQ